MKPVHESAAVVITTSQQRRLIEQLMDKHLEEGGSVLAQVFHDGFRVRVLTPDQTTALLPAISRALGGANPPGQIRHSAFNNTDDKGATA